MGDRETDALANIGIGATTGAAYGGPIGAIVGGVTGLFGSLFASDSAEAEEEAAEAQRQASMASAGLMEESAYISFDTALKNAFLIREEANIVLDDILYKASNRERDVVDFMKQQKMSYISSGVETTGSPALILNETLTKGYEEVDRMREQGARLHRLRMYQAAFMEETAGSELELGFEEAALTRKYGDLQADIGQDRASAIRVSGYANTINSAASLGAAVGS